MFEETDLFFSSEIYKFNLSSQVLWPLQITLPNHFIKFYFESVFLDIQWQN